MILSGSIFTPTLACDFHIGIINGKNLKLLKVTCLCQLLWKLIQLFSTCLEAHTQDLGCDVDAVSRIYSYKTSVKCKEEIGRKTMWKTDVSGCAKCSQLRVWGIEEWNPSLPNILVLLILTTIYI